MYIGWDLRAMDGLNPKPIFVNKSHTAGVCSAQWNPHVPHILVTGSYDGNVKLWDDRMLDKQPLYTYSAGGGVWRLKWHPQSEQSHMLLAACMRGGFRVLKTSPSEMKDPFTSSVIECTHENHDHGSENLAYGVDWLKHESIPMVGSASFYNHELRLWSIE